MTAKRLGIASHCSVCWKFHGRAARWTIGHWWRCHVRKTRLVLWLVAWLLVVWVSVSEWGCR